MLNLAGNGEVMNNDQPAMNSDQPAMGSDQPAVNIEKPVMDSDEICDQSSMSKHVKNWPLPQRWNIIL